MGERTHTARGRTVSAREIDLRIRAPRWSGGGGAIEGPQRNAPHFTDRESQIIGLIANGRTNKQVAVALGISVKTVGTHLQRLYQRRGIHNRSEAVVAWLISDRAG
jgi:DNA-binding CsgD family transcriptional regulator